VTDPDLNKQQRMIGIAPSNSQTGDLVCSFVDSQTALVIRPSILGSKKSKNERYEIVDCGRYTLLGRATIYDGRYDLQSFSEEINQVFKSRLMPDKTIEIIRIGNFALSPEHTPWPATLSTDLPTLQLLTRVESKPMLCEFSEMLDSMQFYDLTIDQYMVAEQMHRQPLYLRQRALEPEHTCVPASIHNHDKVIPSRSANFSEHRIEESGFVKRRQTVELTQKTLNPEHSPTAASIHNPAEVMPSSSAKFSEREVNDSSFGRLQQLLDLEEAAQLAAQDSLYMGISNLWPTYYRGNTSYLSCMLQLLYMLKPFRMVFSSLYCIIQCSFFAGSA
jgi:hypothetical protein